MRWFGTWRSHVGVGEFTTHFGLYFSRDWDVRWGYNLDFDHILMFPCWF